MINSCSIEEAEVPLDLIKATKDLTKDINTALKDLMQEEMDLIKVPAPTALLDPMDPLMPNKTNHTMPLTAQNRDSALTMPALFLHNIPALSDPDRPMVALTLLLRLPLSLTTSTKLIRERLEVLELPLLLALLQAPMVVPTAMTVITSNHTTNTREATITNIKEDRIIDLTMVAVLKALTPLNTLNLNHLRVTMRLQPPLEPPRRTPNKPTPSGRQRPSPPITPTMVCLFLLKPLNTCSRRPHRDNKRLDNNNLRPRLLLPLLPLLMVLPIILREPLMTEQWRWRWTWMTTIAR